MARKKAVQRERDWTRRFYQLVTWDSRAPCFLQGVLTPGSAERACTPRIEAHHVLRRQVLRTVLADQDWRNLHDPNNGVPLCTRHHYYITNRTLLIPREWLPLRIIKYARAMDVEWALDRDCPPGGRFVDPEDFWMRRDLPERWADWQLTANEEHGGVVRKLREEK